MTGEQFYAKQKTSMLSLSQHLRLLATGKIILHKARIFKKLVKTSMLKVQVILGTMLQIVMEL